MVWGGGQQNKVLLRNINSMTTIASLDKSMRSFTGGVDGMMLAWESIMEEGIGGSIIFCSSCQQHLLSLLFVFLILCFVMYCCTALLA